MDQIIDNFRSLGRARLLTMAGVGLALVLALTFGLSAVMSPNWRALYSNLTPSTASGIVSTLEQAGFSPRLSADGAVVSLPEGDLVRARMALAEAGLPGDGAPGWELFDSAGGLGMNTFLQRVNRLRAMEGELARSIQTLDGVDSARVHLVLPEREAFSRNRPDPSASVIIRTRPTHEMTRRQALAVRNLVAASVPELSPSRVTVMSATGEMILSEEMDSTGETGLQSVRSAIEDRMARSIEAILTARVGAGNARVQVSVDLSNEREVLVQQSFDPEQQVARSISSRTEAAQGTDGGTTPVGVQGNLPEALGGVGPGAGSSDSRNRAEDSTQFEIGNTRRETVTEAGDLRRVSVAVLVNGIHETSDGGDAVYQERPAEELERLAQLVRASVGFDAARGDTVSVDSLRFMDYSSGLGEPVRTTLGQTLIGALPSVLRSVFALLIVAAVLLLGVRPVLNRVWPEEAAALPRPPQPGKPDSPEGGDARMVEGPKGTPKALTAEVPEFSTGRVEQIPEGEAPEDYVRLVSVQGAVLKRHLEAMGRLVEDEQEASLRMLRGWLAQGN